MNLRQKDWKFNVDTFPEDNKRRGRFNMLKLLGLKGKWELFVLSKLSTGYFQFCFYCPCCATCALRWYKNPGSNFWSQAYWFKINEWFLQTLAIAMCTEIFLESLWTILEHWNHQTINWGSSRQLQQTHVIYIGQVGGRPLCILIGCPMWTVILQGSPQQH